jgi:hypothetical protein
MDLNSIARPKPMTPIGTTPVALRVHGGHLQAGIRVDPGQNADEMFDHRISLPQGLRHAYYRILSNTEAFGRSLSA